ncbi:MAG: hypothetical protein LIO80_07315 [Lachnospiraceae bacterium]|nr:hypothetical protein [Lachnospiraceae bacterium]
MEIEEQYRRDQDELEEYFLTRQAASEQESLEEQLEMEAWGADLKKKQDELNTDIGKVKQHKAKIMQEDPSRQEWMQKIRGRIMADKNTVNITIVMTKEERKALKLLALEQDISVSALIRQWLQEPQKDEVEK